MKRFLSSVLGKKTAQSARRDPRQARLTLEPLERRELMAVIGPIVIGPIVGLASISDPVAGVVHVYGSWFGENTASVSNFPLSQVLVQINGIQRYFSRSSVSRIEFNGGPMKDTFSNDTSISTTAFGGDGNDVLVGGSGDDFLYGGIGTDTLYGQGSNDWMEGGDGRDTLYGQGGNDTLYGGGYNLPAYADANDWMEGGDGGDGMYGQAGYDTMYGGGFNVPAYADIGDWMEGGDGSDTMYGQAGIDCIYGGGLNVPAYADTSDWMEGGDSIDWMYGQAGNDTMYGGGFKLPAFADDWDWMEGGDGSDTMYGQNGADTMYGGGWYVTSWYDTGDKMYGGSGTDKLYGQAGNDALYGGSHYDQLDGGSGNDGLFGGGAGSDALVGGPGFDRFLKQGDDYVQDASFPDDAIISFVNGAARTVSLNRQSVSFGAGMWSDSEIESIDGALAVLAARTGDTRLLKSYQTNIPNGYQFERVGTSTGGYMGYNPGDGNLVFANSTFPSQFVTWTTIWHEIAHTWQVGPICNEFYDVTGPSKWTPYTIGAAAPAGFTRANWDGTDQPWVYATGTKFARDYGRTGPGEDWATTWEGYFTWQAGLTWQYGADGPGNIMSKIVLVDQFLDNLPVIAPGPRGSFASEAELEPIEGPFLAPAILPVQVAAEHDAAPAVVDVLFAPAALDRVPAASIQRGAGPQTKPVVPSTPVEARLSPSVASDLVFALVGTGSRKMNRYDLTADALEHFDLTVAVV